MGLSRPPFGSSSWQTVCTATSFELTPSPIIHPNYHRIQKWEMNIKKKQTHLFLSPNLCMVAKRSIPIKSPICLPTDELNSSRYFFSSHIVSLSGGESMNDILNEVKGRCLRVDQPSQIMDTLDWLRYIKLSIKEYWRKGIYVPQLHRTLSTLDELLSRSRLLQCRTSWVCRCLVFWGSNRK